MKKLIFFVCGLLVVISTNATLSTPIETENFVREEIGSSAAKLLADVVKLYGYKCDSITSVRSLYFSNGFNIQCNYFRYSYDVEDKGGRWIVTVD